MSFDDIPTAYIHEEGCEPWTRCRVCLVEEIDAIILLARFPQQQALPEGESTFWQTYMSRCEARGPWPETERSILSDLVWRLVVGTLQPGAGEHGFWSCRGPDEMLWQHPDGSRWARVRISVEVLDGIP